MTHPYGRLDSFTSETWLICIWETTHSYVRHDPFVFDITLNLSAMALVKRGVRHDWSIHETWLIHKWDDKFVWDTWLMRTWDMTHSYVTSRSISLLDHASQCSPAYSVRDFWFCDIWSVTLEWLSEYLNDSLSSWYFDVVSRWERLTHSYAWHDAFLHAIFSSWFWEGERERENRSHSPLP